MKVFFVYFPKGDKLFVNNYMYRIDHQTTYIRTDELVQVFGTDNDCLFPICYVLIGLYYLLLLSIIPLFKNMVVRWSKKGEKLERKPSIETH